ncbi:hypothetical protein [Paenibacillus sp. JNUCC31]|uniref:hypothetical protein n=1 Tax=Paenibacillus sp. JNUCC-31 TaxID=2777983 RepID=UPI001E4E1FD0|nr:hypothetical protein [Paenibacillus sp. JNUCC-31]
MDLLKDYVHLEIHDPGTFEVMDAKITEQGEFGLIDQRGSTERIFGSNTAMCKN